MSDGAFVTRENWRQAVADAIEELPSDISVGVGWKCESDNCVVVTTFIEPPISDSDSEEGFDPIRLWVRLYCSRRELFEFLDAECPEYAKEIREQAQGKPDGEFLYLEDCECVWVCACGKDVKQEFKKMLQLRIVHSLVLGSEVEISADGTFIRTEDGSKILDWQTPSR